MKLPFRALLVASLAAMALAPGARAQSAPEQAPKSGRKAFGLSLLVPGLGHRYVRDGSWAGAASLFATADAALWLGLLGTSWSYDQRVESYTTLAASRADAFVEGKDRRFFLNLASFRSSDEYLEVRLRERAWDEIDYVQQRTNQWRWASEEDFRRFRSLREEAESLRRRRPMLAALLFTNRLVSGITAVRAAHRRNEHALGVALAPPPPDAALPLLQVRARF